MTKRMLIDSTHAEETRVVVLDGNRLEDFDVETSTKQQLKGNIYLAKIVRVEPSLQAAFVEFGGGRHGFLAFSEIHPDYYQIPVADRKRLLEMQEAEAREEEEEEEREARRRERGGAPRPEGVPPEPRGEIHVPDEPDHNEAGHDEAGHDEAGHDEAGHDEAGHDEAGHDEAGHDAGFPHPDEGGVSAAEPDATDMPQPGQVAQAAAMTQDLFVAPHEAETEFLPATTPPETDGADLAPEMVETLNDAPHADGAALDDALPIVANPSHDDAGSNPDINGEAHELHDPDAIPPSPAPEHIGGELDTDDRDDRRQTPRFMRNYKIQEVMRRRQILLVQVVKEERGSKGAALTTYISLAGRFSVLMPNSPRGGGISRKITSAADRRRLKEITAELELPRGMGLIVRTAGAARPKPEIIRDCEYLLNQWDQIRDTTMKSMAPTLIYEEASLIKRAIRDVYSRDVDEILVDGEEGWRAARDFMRMLMPAHAKKVQLWRDPQPLFAKAQVEAQLDSMLQPTVQLRSGGYLVINQTEALVAIDVNSGRSTRERGIEETALRTNMEAAEEAARQLRLRDLAGLIVIDFIDMESRRNNASVERKLKDALKNDRARIQVGSISHFGLLEMSRQRLRPSLTETSSTPCPHCGGTGHMRSTESAALAVLRGIEDEGSRRRAAEIVVHVHGSIALYVLNHKRVRLAEIEARFGMHVTFQADDSMIPPAMRIEKIRALLPSDVPVPIAQSAPEPIEDDPDDAVMEADDIDSDIPEPPQVQQPHPAPKAVAAAEDTDEEAAPPGETAAEGEQRKRRRRRRRGGRREDGTSVEATAATDDAPAGAPTDAGGSPQATAPTAADTTAGDAVASDEMAAEGAGAPAEPGDDATMPEGERKRRGRRGGRRRRREPGSEGTSGAEGEDPAAQSQSAPEPSYTPPAYVPPAYVPAPYVPSYAGPTPANPFGGDSNAFSFFDAVEEMDQTPTPRPVAVVAPVAVQPPPLVPAPAPTAAVSKPEPNPAPAAATVVGPAVVPIVLGAPDAPEVEKKKGWWRR